MNHVIMSTDHCPHGWAHVSSVSRQPLEEESQIMQTSGHLHSRAVLRWSDGASLVPDPPSAYCRYVLLYYETPTQGPLAFRASKNVDEFVLWKYIS